MNVADGTGMTHPTVEERIAAGKAARTAIPRRCHASWDPPAHRADPISLLESQAASRVEELLPIRYARMQTSGRIVAKEA